MQSLLILFDSLLSFFIWILIINVVLSWLIGFNILVFIFISLISRGLRFFLVSYLSFKFGHLFTEFMEQHGSKWFTIIGILIVIIGIIIYLMFKSDVQF